MADSKCSTCFPPSSPLTMCGWSSMGHAIKHEHAMNCEQASSSEPRPRWLDGKARWRASMARWHRLDGSMPNIATTSVIGIKPRWLDGSMAPWRPRWLDGGLDGSMVASMALLDGLIYTVYSCSCVGWTIMDYRARAQL